jgi:hypothetical protein
MTRRVRSLIIHHVTYLIRQLLTPDSLARRVPGQEQANVQPLERQKHKSFVRLSVTQSLVLVLSQRLEVRAQHGKNKDKDKDTKGFRSITTLRAGL